MHFIKGKPGIDLGDTSIENIFIDTYMPTADGNYVKVYILGYKFACDPESSAGFTNKTIAHTLNMLLSDVLKAWDYWEKKGIVTKHYNAPNNKDNYTIEFLSLKQLVIDNSYIPITEESGLYKEKHYTPSHLTEALHDSNIRDMFHNIQQLMSRPLNPSESLQCLEWLYDYKMSPEVIEEAFRYSIEKKGIKHIKYINAVITNWYDNSITSMEKLCNFLETADKRYSQYNKIMKAIGLTRNPSKKEKEYMNKWFEEYNMPVDVLIKACDTAFMRKTNPTMAYIDGIVADWFKNGLKTINQIETYIQDRKPSQKNTTKNKFHNFDQPALKYTDEQLKDIWDRKENA